MDPNQYDQIATLLREGLDHYGEDQVDAAVRAWQRVLELDPDNADARDYIGSVDVVAESVANEAVELDARDLTLLEETLALASDGNLGEAYRLIEGGLEGQQLDLEALTVLELVRGRLLRSYRARIDADGMPRAAVSADEIAKFNLPPQATFLVALCDGRTPVSSLAEASGMDDFDALHNLTGLMDAGIVACHAEVEA